MLGAGKGQVWDSVAVGVELSVSAILYIQKTLIIIKCQAVKVKQPLILKRSVTWLMICVTHDSTWDVTIHQKVLEWLEYCHECE